MSRPKDDHKIAQIFSAALRIIMKDGFSGMRMGDVAKEAGVATGTVYVYFQNKNELIKALYLHLKKQNAERLLSGYDISAPFMKGFRALWYAYLEATLAYPEESAFLEQYYRSPYSGESEKLEADSYRSPVFKLLERGKAEFLIKNIPTSLLAAQLVGPIHELARMEYSIPGTLSSDIKETAFRMAWDAVKS